MTSPADVLAGLDFEPAWPDCAVHHCTRPANYRCTGACPYCNAGGSHLVCHPCYLQLRRLTVICGHCHAPASYQRMLKSRTQIRDLQETP